MNDFTIKTPTIRVPGLLDDAAMQEQLKLFKQSGVNGGATAAPTGAVEMADRVQSQFFDAPVKNTLRLASMIPGPQAPALAAASALTPDAAAPKKVDEQQQAIDTRSDVLTSPGFDTFSSLMLGVTAPEGGVIDRLGTLTPEESAAEQQSRDAYFTDREATVKRSADTRAQLRSLTEEQATQLGIPVQQGVDQQTVKEQNRIEGERDAQRVVAAGERVTDNKSEAPKKAWWLDAINSFDRSFADIMTGMGKSAAIGLWELPGEVTGIRNSGRSDIRAWFDTVDATMNKLIPPDKARDQDFINLLSGGTGSMTGFLAAGYIGKTLGLPGNTAMTVAGAASQASVQYEDAEAHNGTELQRLISFFAGAGLGATEGLPLNRMLARAERATGGLVTRTLRNTAAGSLEEFMQEFSQNVGQDVAAQWIYDENRKMNWGQYFKAGAVGAILGGIGGTATTVLQESGVTPRNETAEEQDATKAEDRAAQTTARDARQQQDMQTILRDTQTQFDTVLAQRAYHGSPHEFDRFSTDYLGSGEGAQAFGWGLYFAENKGIADSYRKTLTVGSRELVSDDGKRVKLDDPTTRAISTMRQPPKDAADALDKLTNDEIEYSNEVSFWEDRLQELSSPDVNLPNFNRRIGVTPLQDAEFARDYVETKLDRYRGSYDDTAAALKFMRAHPEAKFENAKGRLYEVELPEDNELLVYDEKLNKQPAAVQDVVKVISKLFADTMGDGDAVSAHDAKFWQDIAEGKSDITGRDFYEMVSDKVGDDEVVSRIFADYGIPGHKFLDANSRDKGEGRYNFVMYDDSRVSLENYASRAKPPSRVIDLPTPELLTLASRAPKSDAFKTWFGDSKVVDAAGSPLVVYHGGNAGEFVAGQTFFAANPELASKHAGRSNARTERTNAVTPAYINMQNPLVVDFKDKASYADLRLTTVDMKPEAIRSNELSRVSHIASAASKKAVAGGYDGVILRNWKDLGVSGDMYVVTEPTQIKSVNNAGNFDPTDPDILASTSQARGSYNAEQKRDPNGVTGASNPAADNISLRQISDNLTKLLDLTVRQGRFTLKGADVMGQFASQTGVIRMRTVNDLSTLVHEAGHALEVNSTGPLKTFVAGNKTMLHTIARQLYGGDTTKMSQKQLSSEGFAEFFRVYVTNRRYAEINYPTITTDFDTLLDANMPDVKAGLKLIGDQYHAWLQMPSSQLVRNMIQTGKETTGVNAKLKEMREQGLVNWFREAVNGLHAAAINRNDNLNTLVANVLNTSEARNNRLIDLKRAEDPRVLIRMAANSGNRAMVQLTDGVMPHRSVNPSTPGLRDVLLRYHGLPTGSQLQSIDPVRQRDFAAYAVALRGIDEYSRFAQGVIERPPLAATLGDLTITVKEMEAKYGDDFKDAAQMIHAYGMGLWQKSFDAGLLDDQTYQDGMGRAFYVPLQRDMSDKDISQSGISAAQVSQGRSIVKQFKGSDRDIIDPVDALMQKTFALEKVIAENEVKVALAKLADKAGTVGALVERVPASRLLGQQYSVQEIARSLTKDPTVSATDAADLMALLDAAIDDGNRIALFRSQQASAAGENIVFFWEKGKLAALQLVDGDLGADVLNLLNAVGTESVPLLVDLISYPSTVFRAAVTSWPDFLVVNFIRDQMSAFVLTEGYTPFVSGLKGVADELRQNDWARQYNAAMGTMGGMNTATLHDARINTDVNALRKKGYIARVFSDRTLTGAVKALGRVTELTETGTRLAIYRNYFDRAKADGLTEWEASIEASYASTDYIDFGLHGNRMMAWRRLIPFLNAQLQGLNKMVRTLAGDEVRQRKGLMFAMSAFFKDTNGLQLTRTEQQAVRTGRKAWLKMSSLGLISAALSLAFKDDPDYQDASEYMRTTGWVIPIGDGQIIYIPKPFELAMVANFVERGIESAGGDGEASARLLRGMAMNLLPPTNPPAIQSIIEQMANWDSFSGREIVPDYMQALEPELQYNHYTSEFAKNLGSLMGMSPMRLDHAMSSFGASAYRDLSFAYNATDPSRPSSDVTDWPMTRRFVRDVRRGAVSSQDFWKYASTVNGSLRRAELTYRNYLDSGRDAAANEYLQELEPDARAYAVLNAHFKADFKKLNPTYRTRQLTTIISAMRRELYSDQGVENTEPTIGAEFPVTLSAREKGEADTLFSELARREVRNQLVYMKAPGWAGKKPLPTEPTLDILRTLSPDMADEFDRRVKKAKIYDAQTVQEYWPEVRDRLLQDGEEAFLKDIQAVAKAMR